MHSIGAVEQRVAMEKSTRACIVSNFMRISGKNARNYMMVPPTQGLDMGTMAKFARC